MPLSGICAISTWLTVLMITLYRVLKQLLLTGFENGVSIRTGYQWVNTEYSVDNSKDADAHIIPVYVNYNVTPNFNVWAEARFDVGTDDEFYAYTNEAYDLTENVYSVGARYSF